MADGASYDGQFSKNETHGQGLYTWADGDGQLPSVLSDQKTER